jgi:hypothetical protein
MNISHALKLILQWPTEKPYVRSTSVVGENITIIRKRFDTRTGLEKDPDIYTITKTQLNTYLNSIKDQATIIKAFKTELGL